jgi:hypothetical protein
MIRLFLIKLLLIYGTGLTTICLTIVEFLLFAATIFQKLNKRLIRETQSLLDKYSESLNVMRIKK